MQLFDLNGWDYQKKILAQCNKSLLRSCSFSHLWLIDGRIIRVKALFGVRHGVLQTTHTDPLCRKTSSISLT